MIYTDVFQPKNVASIFGIDDILLATAGSSLISGLTGASSAKKQLSFEKQQAAVTNKIAQEQQALAEELANRGIATQIDANGNVTAYDKTTNTWKTQLSPTQQSIQNMSDREQIAQLTVDAPVARQENLVNAIARSKAGGTADMARQQLEDSMRSGYNGVDLGNILRGERTAAVNKGFDDVSSSLTQQALRSGAAGGGAIAGALAKQRAQAIAQSMGSPTTEGLTLADQLNQNKIASRFNTFSGVNGIASGAPASSVTLPNITGGVNSTANATKTAAQSSLANAGSLLGQSGQLVNGVQTPNYTGASNAGILATLLGPGGAGSDILTQLLKNRTSSASATPKISVDPN